MLFEFEDNNIEKNLNKYYEKLKKLKQKLIKVDELIKKNENKIKKIKNKEEFLEKLESQYELMNKEWYEKFRWFFTSNNKLAIGGRDATTNEIIIKKHVDKNDIIFHSDLSGSPFFILKDYNINDLNKEENKKIAKEVADITISYSKAWKLKYNSLECFYVKPEQVTKKTKAGEYINKGSFMIYGKKNYIFGDLMIGIGIIEKHNEEKYNNKKLIKFIIGNKDSIKKHSKKYVLIIPGDNKTSDIAKKILNFFNIKSNKMLDEIIRLIPAGGSKIIEFHNE